MARKRAALRVWWSKRENGLMVDWDKQKSDGHWFIDLIGVAMRPGRDDFVKILRDRGFDPETFRCSVDRLKETPPAT